MPSEETCAACRFWLDSDGDPREHKGYCRRKSPQIIGAVVTADMGEYTADVDNSTIYMATRFPITTADEWCGKWREHPRYAEQRRVARIEKEEAEKRERAYADSLRAGLADDQPF